MFPHATRLFNTISIKYKNIVELKQNIVVIMQISANVADMDNVSTCYNAIESAQQLNACDAASNDLFAFTTFMIFQGLSNVSYMYTNENLTNIVRTSGGGHILITIRRCRPARIWQN
jgi:hypothetical protein